MTVSIWLYNEFSSRNLLRREGNDVMVQMLTLPFIFDNKCPLPRLCDEFHRQKTCTKVFLLFTLLDFELFVILECPASVVRACVRPCVRQQFLLTASPLKPLIGFWPNLTGMIPGWSPIKVVQTVPVGCISRSRGKKIGFQNAIFKNLLVWNYKA